MTIDKLSKFGCKQRNTIWDTLLRTLSDFSKPEVLLPNIIAEERTTFQSQKHLRNIVIVNQAFWKLFDKFAF